VLLTDNLTLLVTIIGSGGIGTALGVLLKVKPERDRIVVDAASLPYVQGTTLDVVQEGLARRLRFANPNALQTCGCGESFGA